MQELVEAWAGKNNEQYSELAAMAALTEGIGKLSHTMAGRDGNRLTGDAFKKEVAAGIGEVMWALAAIANHEGIDITEALAETLARKSMQKKR